jgi:hypothetical protein
MKPLLWKEFRELRAVLLLAAVAFPMCLGPLHLPSVASENLPALFVFAAMISAVALGAGQIVSERSAKTLDYLLGRPVAGRRVVLAKFIAGSTVLLIFIGLFLALVFLGAKATDIWLVAATQFGYFRLLVYQFPMYWCLYACTLLFSSVVEQRAQAIAGGLVCLLAVVSISIAATLMWPLQAPDVWFPVAVAERLWLELTRETSLWLVVAVVWSGLSILVAAAAALILERRWEMRVGWPLLGLIFVVFGVGPRFIGQPAEEVQPVGVFSLGARAISGPVADGSRVSVASQEGLVVIDFSDPAGPRRLGQVRLPLWTIERQRMVGDDLYVAGRHKDIPVDTAGVLRVRMRAAGNWEATQIVNLGPWDSQAWIGEPYVIGKHLYLGLRAGEESRLRVFELSADGPARQTADVPIEHWPLSTGIYALIRGVPPSTMAVRGASAYVAGNNVLLTLDLGDPSNPKVVHRTQLDDVALLPTERKLACLGNRLYVESFRPPMLRRYDLQEPARPREIGRSIWRPSLGSALVADEARATLSVAWNLGVLTFPPPEGLWIRDVRYLKGTINPVSLLRTEPVAAAGGFFYVLLQDERVAAYRVPR